MAAKACDTCKSVAGSGFMCVSCDNTIQYANNNNKLVPSRVWMCEVCEEAPAAVTCKADAAALCVTCDADIHSANHLAHRHQRVPIPSFLNSWSLPTPTLTETNHIKTGDLVFSQMDPFQPATIQVFNNETSFHIDFSQTQHKLPTFSCQSQSFSHSVSSSSVDVGVVPDGNSISDISYPIEGHMTDPSVSVSAKTSNNRAGGIDREARVLRYKEKRKKRKFEKTVRYASRKAYAESRPRIKGRFVKRNEINNQVKPHV